MMHRRGAEILLRFGERLRQLRKERGYSQESFAIEAGLDRSCYGQVERGEQNVALQNQFKIARQLGISLSELFAGM